MDRDLVVAMVLLGVSIVALLSPFDAQTLRKDARERGTAMRWPQALWVAVGATAGGTAVFVSTFFGLAFGVPYLLGDSVGLPWITSLPALLVGALLARAANRAMCSALLRSRSGCR